MATESWLPMMNLSFSIPEDIEGLYASVSENDADEFVWELSPPSERNDVSRDQSSKPGNCSSKSLDLANKSASSCHLEIEEKFQCSSASTVSSSVDDGKAALHLAAENGWAGAVHLILDRTHDARARDNVGRTALHLAAQSGHPHIVQELLDTMDVFDTGLRINAQDNRGKTVLHIAAEMGREEIIGILLNRKETDVHARIH